MGFFSKIKGVTHNVEDVETPVPAMFATRNDTVYAPISGMLVSQKEINDEVISQGLLGQGYGVLPVGNVVYAPVNGRVDVVTVTNHAIGILTDNGAKVLVHVGLDTIKMDGKGFKRYVEAGRRPADPDVRWRGHQGRGPRRRGDLRGEQPAGLRFHRAHRLVQHPARRPPARQGGRSPHGDEVTPAPQHPRRHARAKRRSRQRPR